MIETLLPWMVLFLLANLATGLWRAWRGPTDGDRMLSALLFGTTSVAILVLMADWLGIEALRSVALLLVMFATIISLAFFGIPAHEDDDG
ncbi:MAG: pH regulation protein F [Wenzhouxiangellaceae bacterium]